MKLGLLLPLGVGGFGPGGEEPARWADLRAMARLGEDVGFDTLVTPDHLLFRRSPPTNSPAVVMAEGRTRGIWEAWTVLSALAEATHRVALCPLVACTSFRNPALLAKMADTLEEVSGGRLLLGLGAGWHEPEYVAFGFPFDHRVSRFEEALAIIVPLLREGRVDFSGQYYQARDCELAPRGPRRTGPPILIGATQPRMMRLAARYADYYDADYQLGADGAAAKFATLEAACREVGRAPSAITRAAGARIGLAEPGAGPAEPIHQYELAGMQFGARRGSPEELLPHLTAFRAAGVEHLTISLYPPGPRAIERFAPLIPALKR
jgi:alkanesulfonate monooxygenase SsuD/methylene tetrahydromethanopterin reductase-like flavin-dependent oxidoreductase (luciferase family)